MSTLPGGSLEGQPQSETLADAEGSSAGKGGAAEGDQEVDPAADGFFFDS